MSIENSNQKSLTALLHSAENYNEIEYVDFGRFKKESFKESEVSVRKLRKNDSILINVFFEIILSWELYLLKILQNINDVLVYIVITTLASEIKLFTWGQ